jgi:hypothetical protein
LAGGSADKKVNCSIIICSYGGEIAVQWHGRIVMRQHGARECLNLTEEGRLPA